MRNLTLLIGVFTMSGCFMLPGTGYDEDWDTYEEVHVVDAQIQDAWLAGDMRDLGTFEGDAYEVSYYNDRSYGSSITLHAGEAGGSDFGWAMLRLTTQVEGGFESDTFAPGARLTVESGQLDAQGCTGPAYNNFDFDGYANQIEVEVEEGPTPNSRLFHFRAVFDQADGGETEGSFILLDEPTAPGTVNG